MHIADFDRTAREIENELVSTHAALQQDHTFAWEERKCFDDALRNLFSFLTADSDFAKVVKEPWQAARRFIKLSLLENKINKIRRTIFDVSHPPYFSRKISKDVLPSLANRIQELKLVITAISCQPLILPKTLAFNYHWFLKPID